MLYASSKGEKLPKALRNLFQLHFKDVQINLIHSSSIYLYMKMSLYFYLQASCKDTYFTFTSLSAYPRKERGKKTHSLRSGQCHRSTKEWLTKLPSHVSGVTYLLEPLFTAQSAQFQTPYILKTQNSRCSGQGNSAIGKYGPIFPILPQVKERINNIFSKTSPR